MIRRTLLTAIAAASLLAGCAKPAPDSTINFSILSAEDQTSMSKVWQPLLDDLTQQTGLKVKPFFAGNYTALIEAMRFNQTQIGWFSALPALEAVNRANSDVLVRVVTSGGEGVYESVLITKKGSGITLDDVLKCGKRYSFGIGDARSTSGTLAPMAYVFIPHRIEPADCFKVMRSASHQSNLFSVANGVLDVATNNTVGLVFAKRENPELADKIQVIWTSPPLPESSIVARKDLDPKARDKLKTFFLNYGKAAGAEGDHERQVLKGLAYAGFMPAGDGYLDPIREMDASQTLGEAKKSGEPAKVDAAQKAYDAVEAQVAAHKAAQSTQGPARS
ncbi:MAG TPA: phosphate/phosphite/phosphonate ABC transporter substrate-binding protein [Caulobacteraceae bacterium]|jgi:phosphonate transport system substrate-binding protein